MTYTAIIEPTSNGYSGIVAELGNQVIAAGDTVDEVEQLLLEATRDLLQAYRSEGRPIPQPEAEVRRLDIA